MKLDSIFFYKILVDKTWTVVNDDTGTMGPYAYGQGNWVGYDDSAMATEKVNYIIDNKIGGAIIWDISKLLL